MLLLSVDVVLYVTTAVSVGLCLEQRLEPQKTVYCKQFIGILARGLFSSKVCAHFEKKNFFLG